MVSSSVRWCSNCRSIHKKVEERIIVKKWKLYKIQKEAYKDRIEFLPRVAWYKDYYQMSDAWSIELGFLVFHVRFLFMEG